MNHYSVILTFTFNAHSLDECIRTDDDQQTREYIAKKYAETRDYFTEHSIIDHVKRIDASEFVEYLFNGGTVTDAQWLDGFQMKVVVESDDDPDDFYELLMMTSLDDGEYESCGDNGWTVKFINDDDMNEYGLTTYKHIQPVVIKMNIDA